MIPKEKPEQAITDCFSFLQVYGSYAKTLPRHTNLREQRAQIDANKALHHML
jgi:hypothetical protein